MSKHIDFTQLKIIDMEGYSVSVERLEPWFIGDHQCECCGDPRAEYLLTSMWDPMGQCTIAECQACMVLAYSDPTHPDKFAVDGVQVR